eukprot:CAMPEP_0172736936 /NCGR_PEP_ID=MMETSP1074-20121228/116390_1 /TAXON_ID=2916 /ORGANISM="Ceratium fusus, Strain PA161109" /LENGTH=187 /DNA_ID=CAMNT_0013566239 /DNA_START=70 /DNA_END=633 /DNA_ORIENTATION=+
MAAGSRQAAATAETDNSTQSTGCPTHHPLWWYLPVAAKETKVVSPATSTAAIAAVAATVAATAAAIGSTNVLAPLPCAAANPVAVPAIRQSQLRQCLCSTPALGNRFEATVAPQTPLACQLLQELPGLLLRLVQVPHEPRLQNGLLRGTLVFADGQSTHRPAPQKLIRRRSALDAQWQQLSSVALVC